ncbi:MAG TPA: helix-turn-helix domain-containing protein [Polaromonas sp.]|uniref:winged helix-turn-helix transcriptional regulator n=1 Tax=Polaromonas sp. TaxID=1869339 RepID=UPI002D654080|nr:helix-turn-helix domain-containing protein [Polaromonas sp.]HYW55355.1 helix-turn-helix domain-containing protein [Polaromonas sp.]
MLTEKSPQRDTLRSDGDAEVTPEASPSSPQEWADCDYAGPCPVRDVYDRIGDKWSVLVMLQLGVKPLRFRELLRAVGVISQRVLTVTLRGLERDGLVLREVMDTRPPGVRYRLSPLGQSLLGALRGVASWAAANHEAMAQAREAYDVSTQPVAGQVVHRL